MIIKTSGGCVCGHSPLIVSVWRHYTMPWAIMAKRTLASFHYAELFAAMMAASDDAFGRSACRTVASSPYISIASGAK